MSALDQMRGLVRPVAIRVANLLARAVVQLVRDSGGIQTLQLGILDQETREGCERLQEYGLTSHPHPGAEAAVAFVGGRRDHGLVLAVDDRRYRLTGLLEGEVALYTDEGDFVRLRRGRIVEVKAGTKVRLDAPLAELTGNLLVAGTLVVTGGVTAASVSAGSVAAGAGGISDAGGTMASMRSVFNSHTHVEHGTGGGVTSPPATGM